ncbi:hypothetical protein E2C01_081369 [Portunus trituberculatus]|uniref:Uncharacterized protein n=1 Tax=Portunus trituberculatus TaxID=210409 RepID=A0A5B7J0Y3_PORTR|nr:hypothetical protein [Portunus trituberculatus]
MIRRCMLERDHWRLVTLWLAGMTLVLVKQVVWPRIGQPVLLNSGSDPAMCVSLPQPYRGELGLAGSTDGGGGGGSWARLLGNKKKNVMESCEDT